MKLNDFLKQNALGEKEITIEGIDEKFKIKQLSMVEQLEIMEKHDIELKEKEDKLTASSIKKNANFRKEVILKGLLHPKIDEKAFENLNQEGLNLLSKIADEILSFTNQSPKQESKDD